MQKICSVCCYGDTGRIESSRTNCGLLVFACMGSVLFVVFHLQIIEEGLKAVIAMEREEEGIIAAFTSCFV